MEYGSQDVKCPFYKTESGNSIKCEGLISSTCNNNFGNNALKRKHWKSYCCEDYDKCIVNESLMRKYL